MKNHLKTFDLAFFYINYGYVWLSILWETPPNIIRFLRNNMNNQCLSWIFRGCWFHL
jgi:hypothetical protein